MESDVLMLLPPRGLDQSILLAVLMGLFVLLFLTECFGWVFAGLVVPGYLASVFVMSTGAGVAVVFEAIITFLLARFLTGFVSKTEAGTQFFGRERFFLIVLISVIVRQNSEIWLLPLVAPKIDALLGTTFAAKRQLASIGLVLVPLTANMFWKHKLHRGLLQVGVPVAVTYALLTYVVLPYTNLSYSSLELTYENTALDFLASPKAYIILLVGANLASRFNLTYGWDYNGILVPALLSLTWMEPLRVLTTVIEALVLLYAAMGFMKLPKIRTMNLEGPRKIVLVFIIGFLLKYIFSWVIGDHAPTQRVTDLFGFGYILPSLLATKMLQKKTVGRVLLPALETSLLAFILANLLGMGLDFVDPHRSSPPETDTIVSSPTSVLVRSPLGVAMAARTRVRLDVGRMQPLERSRAQLLDYQELWRDIDRELRKKQPDIDRLIPSAEALGLDLRRITIEHDQERNQSVFILMEEEESLMKQAGWDTSLLFPGRSGPILAVPRPDDEPDAAAGALWTCERIHCRAVLISGVDTRRVNLPEGDALTNPRTSFNFAHRALELAPILHVRIRDDASGEPGEDPTILYAKGRLSSDLNLAKLWADELDIRWQRPSGANVQWEERENLAVLSIPAATMAAKLSESTAQECTWPIPDITAFLAERLDAPEGLGAFVGPSQAPCAWLARQASAPEEPAIEPRGTGAAASSPTSARISATTDVLRRIAALSRVVRQHGLAPSLWHADSGSCSAQSDLEVALQRRTQPTLPAPLSETELSFLQRFIVVPLMRAAGDPTNATGDLRGLRRLARLIGYELGRVADCGGPGRGCWLLAQHRGNPARSSVIVIVRTGEAAPIAIEAPRPDTEPGTWRLGLELWRRTDARALVIGVPVQGQQLPFVERELRNKRDKIFHAVHQALDTAMAEANTRGLILQVRGYGSWRQLDDPLVIGFGRPLLRWNAPAPLPSDDSTAPDDDADNERAGDERPAAIPRSPRHEPDYKWANLALPYSLVRLIEPDETQGSLPGDGALLDFGRPRPADGAEEIIELRALRNRQLAHSRRIGDTDMAILWFSQATRLKYQEFGSSSQCRELARMGLLSMDTLGDTLGTSPAAYLLQPALAAPPERGSDALAEAFAKLMDTARRTARLENFHIVRKLVLQSARDPALSVRAASDARLGGPYLQLELRGEREVYRAILPIGRDASDTRPDTDADDADTMINIEAGTGDTEALVERALSRRTFPIVVRGAPVRSPR